MGCCSGEGLKAKIIDEDVDLSLIEDSLERQGQEEGSLIRILQDAQEIYGYLPLTLLDYIGAKLKIKRSKIYGVATFYSQFNLNPIGENLISLCDGTACHVNGSEEILEAVYEELGIRDGETSEDKIFSLSVVACLGCCSLAPAMMIGDETYGNLNERKTKRILREIRAKSLAKDVK